MCKIIIIGVVAYNIIILFLAYFVTTIIVDNFWKQEEWVCTFTSLDWNINSVIIILADQMIMEHSWQGLTDYMPRTDDITTSSKPK